MNLGWTTAYFAGAMAAWQYASSWLRRLSGLLMVTVTVEGYAKEAVLRWCWQNLSRSPLGQRRFVVWEEHIRPLGRRGLAPFELPSETLTFFRGWRPLFIGVRKSESNGGSNMGESFTLTCLRGTFDVQAILVNAVKELDQQRHGQRAAAGGRFCVWRILGAMGDGSDRGNQTDAAVPSGSKLTGVGGSADAVPLLRALEEIGEPTDAAPFEKLAYGADVESFIDEVRRWKSSKDWFKSRGIPWRMGAGLFGPPGTGKSSLARAIAQELDPPVHVYDLASMDNRELSRYWDRSLTETPCMVLLEDIDRLFDKDKNLKQHANGRPGITLDCLLNRISGVGNSDGILVIATANDASRLDEALGVPTTSGVSTRPGRLDRVLTVGPLSEAGRRKVAKRILADCPEFIEREVKAGDGETGAQFEKRCADLALSMYWSQPPASVSKIG